MKKAVLQLVLLSILPVVFGDYWEDIVAEFNGDVNDESLPPNENNRDTRSDIDRNNWNNSPNTMAAVNRIMDQLLRQCNGDIAVVLSTLERRFNIRANPNSDQITRLNVIVSTVNSGLTSSGYGYYRPLVNGVAERLGAMIIAQGTISGPRPNVYRPPQSSSSFQGSSSWGFRPGTNNQDQWAVNAQGNDQRPSDKSYNEIADYWALKPQQSNDEWNGPTAIIYSSSSSSLFSPKSDDDWPPHSRRTGVDVTLAADNPAVQQPVTQRPAPQRPVQQRPYNQRVRNSNRRRSNE